MGLPAFLAVSERQDHYIDRFVELSIAEAADCSKRGVRVCRFPTSISKGGQRESCALALLNSDPSAEARLCRRSTMRNNPPTAQYLGKHFWAVSIVNSSIVFRCANSTESRVLGPRATVFELKEGCTAITGQWILPATLHGQRFAGPMRRSGIADLPLWPQWTANTEAGWPLWKTKHVEAGRALHATRLELQDLQRLGEESPTPRYPWELAGGLLLLFLALIIHLAYRWKKFRRSSGSAQSWIIREEEPHRYQQRRRQRRTGTRAGRGRYASSPPPVGRPVRITLEFESSRFPTIDDVIRRFHNLHPRD